MELLDGLYNQTPRPRTLSGMEPEAWPQLSELMKCWEDEDAKPFRFDGLANDSTYYKPGCAYQVEVIKKEDFVAACDLALLFDPRGNALTSAQYLDAYLADFETHGFTRITKRWHEKYDAVAYVLTVNATRLIWRNK